MRGIWSFLLLFVFVGWGETSFGRPATSQKKQVTANQKQQAVASQRQQAMAKQKQQTVASFRQSQNSIAKYPIRKSLLLATGTSESEYRQAYVLLSAVSGVSPEEFEHIVRAYVINGPEFCNWEKHQEILAPGREVAQVASLIDLFFYVIRKPATDNRMKPFLNCFFLYNENPTIQTLAWKSANPNPLAVERLFQTYRSYLRNPAS